MINFDPRNKFRYMGMEIPIHTQKSLENYLIHGWAPGGFVESMIARDYHRALYCADTANRQMFWAIAMYINECMPVQSVGSHKAIEMWRDDLGSRRSDFVKETEQKRMWDILKSTESTT